MAMDRVRIRTAIVFGIAIGPVLGLCLAGFISSLPGSYKSRYNDAIKECEKELPRSQSCKVVGVVDKH